ncbi:MAG: hypothetical protein M1834_004698 [Cirrosporium novae-zelandiae]|nr:MAG: hypothetical protein M1834_004698 [Cirrosporium novae-zelandiae]
MSLLQNEDFVIWQLRTSYLTNIKDGVGERLINVNPGFLNTPGFRLAGWSATAGESKRTYSPPIPTTINSDYFQAPPRSAGLPSLDDEDEGGIITGGGNDTIGPSLATKRRKRRELEDEDSSDLSDDSDDDAEGTHRATVQIKFSKMPVRIRSGSSPIRSATDNGPELLVTSPSRRSTDGRLRRGSLGAVEVVKARARRDTATTTTSSELSSENELDPSLFKRRQISKASIHSVTIQEDDAEYAGIGQAIGSRDGQDSGDESDGTTLSSEFPETAESASLLDHVANPLSSSPLVVSMPPPITPHNTSPKKSRPGPQVLQALPPGRPISMVNPVSLLTQQIMATRSKPENPIACFAILSGKGTPDALNIKIYAPFSGDPENPFEMPILRYSNDSDQLEQVKTSVADAIGLSLWRYIEEDRDPPIPSEKLNVNRWTLRMVEDGEVDYDFPPLQRTQPIVDFTSNNNRGARGRSREKPFDEFALVEANDRQFEENEKLTPKYSQPTTDETATTPTLGEPAVSIPNEVPTQSEMATFNPVLGGPFTAAASQRDITAAADRPVLMPSATPRIGMAKIVRVRYISLDGTTQTTSLDVTTDTYIGEILDSVCKKWSLDKAQYVLKVSGTSTVAPSDRTVEAIGERSDLSLVRRKFGGNGVLSLTGSPGSASPNTPLALTMDAPKKMKRGQMLHPLAQTSEFYNSAAYYKKYNVIRKQPMSFTPSHQRTIAFDGEYMHIMPAETGKTLFDQGGKTTTIPFSSVVGCKISRRHPKVFTVFVFKETETKRYDFEAENSTIAGEIIEEVKKGMKPFQQGGGS